MMHSSMDPPVLLSTERERNRGRKREKEGLFVRLQEQSGLEATAGQPGPQREKKRAFNMEMETADISTLKNEQRERKRREEFNTRKAMTVIVTISTFMCHITLLN